MDYKKHKNRGQTIIFAAVFFVIISTTLVFGLTSPILKEISNTRDLTKSESSYFLAEASVEDVVYRLRNGKQISGSETISINGEKATTTIADVAGKRVVTSTGSVAKNIRKVSVTLSTGSGSAFFYGVQLGQGGFLMENNSVVNGNIYANGPVEGDNSAIVYGDVISAGIAGIIDGIHSTSSAYAHTIKDAIIDKDAHYQTIISTSVGGTSYPGSIDQLETTLPISDTQIDDWEADALSGGVHTSPCPYNITEDVVLGPKKINCDLNISNDPVITLNGNIWVSGNINITNTAILKVAPGLFGKGVVIVADDPLNRTTSSKISLENSTQYIGNGTSSYIMLISGNNSSELGGNEVAIDVKNSATGDLIVYSNHGEVSLSNSINLKEVTAYKLHLKNIASVNYESGLQSLIFTSGPSGGYLVEKWSEIE